MCLHFFLPDFASDSVSLPRLTIHGMCRIKPQTMAGFPSVPSGTASTDNIKPREPNSSSSAIQNRADDDSDSGFARVCSIQHAARDTRES